MGFMGATHLAAFHQLPDVEVSAICATKERVLSGDLTQVGGNLNLPKAQYDFSAVRKYRDWRELVNDPALDAVDICLPTDLHVSVTLAALAAGKHVLCEKPMALDSEGCDRMTAAAEQHGRILMIGQVLRFWPEYLALEQFVKQQAHHMTAVRFVRSAGLPDWSQWLVDERRSGGAVLDLLVHDIDQAVWLFGMPGRVAAKSLGPVDTISAVLTYEQGLHVQIEGGWLAAGQPFSMGFEARSNHALLELTSEGLFRDDETGRHKVQSEKDDAYQAEVGYFVDCCRTGDSPERCMPRDSAKAIKLAALLKDSRERGGIPIEC